MNHHITSTTKGIAVAASYALIVASAGFGCVFAWRIGAQYSLLLACLTVLFALGLELIKPLAISNAFLAFGRAQLGKGLCLTILGVVAVAYSLLAELSLTSMSRTDLVASRTADTKKAASSEAIYATAASELKTLVGVRAKEQIQADIVKMQAQFPRISCNPLGASQSRYACPIIASLRGEIARADRKVQLEKVVQDYASNQAGQVQKVADPSSDALKIYLQALGVSADIDTISKWATIVPVLALELGSALSLVLLSVLTPGVGSPKPTSNGSFDPLGSLLVQKSETRQQMKLRRQAAAKIVAHLENHNGSLNHSERELANLIGADRNTTRRAIQDLGTTGKLSHQPSKKGTALRLLN